MKQKFKEHLLMAIIIIKKKGVRMMTYKQLEKQYKTLSNQLRILFLQNIRESKYDDDILMALNSLTRELLRIRKMMDITVVRGPVDFSELKYNVLV